jgi:catecholate siderophore receptor
MNTASVPRSLRSNIVSIVIDENPEFDVSLKFTVACLVAAGSITGADARESPLPPVTIDAPVARPRPPAAKPTPEHVRVRTAVRRIAREQPKRAQPAPASSPNAVPSAASLPADRDPYANPAAPYMAERLASPKFTEPLINTPRSVTVLTKEVLEDKNATTLKEVGRTTAGVTLGTGEGGNAFGDRFFIRGFDARNDIFIDGVRDPAVSIRENFFTEQIEILRGPASTFAGRGTTGGAINIVTKQATDRSFYDAETTLGTDMTRRVTIDANQVITPTFSMRVDGMFQVADVAGRNYIFDDRWGGLAAAKWTPTEIVKITGNYIHSDLNSLPDFGVPYNKPALAPWTDTGVPRNTFYGFVFRDFQKVTQDIGTVNAEFNLSDAVTIINRFRQEKAINNYVGTLPEQNGTPAPPQGFLNLNPQSRYQVTTVTANQTDAVMKFDTGPVKHSAILGAEVSREHVSIQSYSGLSSEAIGSGAFSGAVSLSGVSVFNPPNLLPFPIEAGMKGNPTIIPVYTNAGYLIDTANFRDFIFLNGGVRYDEYHVGATNSLGSVTESTGMLNYNGDLVIKPWPIASIYTAYATSSNPVGAELDGTSTTYGGLNPGSKVNQIFGPTQNRAMEVGTKWELFDRRLLATGALFQTDVQNAREIIPTGYLNAGTVVAGAAYRVRGIDLEVAGKITDKWSIFGGFVSMQSEVTQSIVSSNIGDKLANVAHNSFNMLTKYNLTDNLEIGGQATYISKIYGGTLLAANQGTVLPDHWRFDAFAEYKLNKNWTTKVFVNNILNKTYYDAFYQSAAPFVLMAPGRAAYLKLEAKF